MKDEEMKNMGRDVFISYAYDKGDTIGSKDRDAADNVYNALETRGIRCWAAHRDILPGDDWLGRKIGLAPKMPILLAAKVREDTRKKNSLFCLPGF